MNVKIIILKFSKEVRKKVQKLYDSIIIKNSRKYKLIYNDRKQITGFLEWGEAGEEIKKKQNIFGKL